MSNKLYLPDTASIYLAIVGNYVFYTWKGPHNILLYWSEPHGYFDLYRIKLKLILLNICYYKELLII
jgi:hypothetical protein